MKKLYEFYGTECPHCINMHKLVEKLEKEEGIKLEQMEVWHNEENEKKMNEINRDMCGGVPFFYNEETAKFICGETDYENFKKWAKGEPFEEK